MRSINWIIIALLILAAGCTTDDSATPSSGNTGTSEPATTPAKEPEPTVEPEPVVESCRDGIRNQDETGIDCGGVCKPCAEPVTEQETVVADKTDSSGNQIIDYEIPEDKLAQLKSKLTVGTPATFLVNSYPSGLNPGESYVYAYGITNMHQKTEKFRFTINFKRAKDLYNNPINGLNEDTVQEWVSHNHFEEIELDVYEQAFIPVGVTVGDEVGPGFKTTPGHYYFEMVTEYWNGGSYDEYDVSEFSFRVK